MSQPQQYEAGDKIRTGATRARQTKALSETNSDDKARENSTTHTKTNAKHKGLKNTKQIRRRDRTE